MTDPEPEAGEQIYRPEGPSGGPLPPSEASVVEPSEPVVEEPPPDLEIPTTPTHDIAARALWTLAEAAVAALIAWAVGLGPEDNPEWFTVVTAVGASVLSAIKSFIGTKVGNPETVTFS